MRKLLERLLEIMPRAAWKTEHGIVHDIHWRKGEVEQAVDAARAEATGDWRAFLDLRRDLILKGGAPSFLQLALADPRLRDEVRPWAAGRTLLVSRHELAPGACRSVRDLHAQPPLTLELADGRTLRANHSWLDVDRERWEGHRAPILALVQLRDGRVASAGQDRTVRFWDPATGQGHAVHDEHWGSLTGLLAWGDGVLSGCVDGNLRDYVHAPLKVGGPVASLVAEPPLVHVALGNGDVETWDIPARTLVRRLSTGCVPLLAVAAAAGQVAAAGQDGAVYCGDRVLVGHCEPVYRLAFLADGSLRSWSRDNTCREWDPQAAAGEVPGHRGPVVALAHHGDRVFSGGRDGRVLSDGAPFTEHPAPICALSVRGDQLVSASDDGTVRLWSLSPDSLREEWTGGKPLAVGWLEDGVPLLVRDGVTMCAPGRWQFPLEFSWSPAQVCSLGVLPSGEILLTSYDPEIYLVRPDGSVRKVRHHNQGYVRAVVLPEVVMSVGYHELAVWKHSGELVSKRQKNNGHTTWLVAHPHEPVVAVHGLVSSSVVLEGLEKGQRRPFEGHLDFLLQVAFEPSGRHLYSLGRDRTVRASRVEDGVHVATWVADCDLTCLTVPAEGSVAVGTALGTVLRLDLVA